MNSKIDKTQLETLTKSELPLGMAFALEASSDEVIIGKFGPELVECYTGTSKESNTH